MSLDNIFGGMGQLPASSAAASSSPSSVYSHSSDELNEPLSYLMVDRPPRSTQRAAPPSRVPRPPIPVQPMSVDAMQDGVIVPGERPERIEGQWDFVAFEQEDWSKVDAEEAEEYTSDPDFCALCENCDSGGANPDYIMLRDYLLNNYSKMRAVELGQQAKRVYEKFLRPHQAQQKAMRCRTFVKHIEEHAPAAIVSLESQIRTHNQIVNRLRDLIKEQDRGTGNQRLHATNLRLYMTTSSALNGLYQQVAKLKGANAQ